MLTYGEVCQYGDYIDTGDGCLYCYEGNNRWRLLGTTRYSKHPSDNSVVISPFYKILRKDANMNSYQVYPELKVEQNMNTVTKVKSASKKPVQTPAQAKSYLRSYLENHHQTKTTVPNSKARWASASEVASYFNVSKQWLGRHLNSASGVQVGTTKDGKLAYRINK